MPQRAMAAIYQMGVRTVVQVLALVALLFGFAIIIGGGGRFAGPSFATARQLPGGYLTWGLLAMGVGGFTLFSSRDWHRRWVMLGLAADSVLFFFFTVSLALTAANDPHVPFTGIVAYGGYSALCAVSYVVGHELRRVRRQ